MRPPFGLYVIGLYMPLQNNGDGHVIELAQDWLVIFCRGRVLEPITIRTTYHIYIMARTKSGHKKGGLGLRSNGTR
jgi:hypothetical protein